MWMGLDINNLSLWSTLNYLTAEAMWLTPVPVAMLSLLGWTVLHTCSFVAVMNFNVNI